MKMRAGFLATCAASALVIGMGYASPAVAADKMVTKAPAAEPVQWWYEGFVEVGGRFNLNSPDKTSLGKFYEYRDLRPGVFGNFYIAAHRNNPIDIAFWGKNVGWDDQAFGFEFAKPGQYYVTLGWDETPHVFARNARTTFSNIGGNVLSSPTYPQVGGVPTPATTAFVDANSPTMDVKYRRDTASAAVRWTPTDSWDINVDYSHMRREGTQPLNAMGFSLDGASLRRTPIELPKPVDDTTQTGNIKGEYSGSTPWGKPFNLALGYGVSMYNTEYNNIVFNNPWNAANSATGPLWNRYSLAPDNNAQTFSLSGGVGLPWNSRYMGTFQYSINKQNDTFLPSTINPLVAPAVLTRGSLDGDARTTLFNNVLNTQITSDLKSTLRYRYYDYHSNHAPVTITGLFANPETNNSAEPALTAVPLNFTKQNASADLAWRATKWLTIGPGYAWERWSRDIAYSDVASTNEHTAKVFADAKWSWSTLRTSLQYGERRFEDPYVNRSANNIPTFRVKEYADRDRFKGMASWAIDLPRNVTVTPNAGFRYDDYGTNPFLGAGVAEIGLLHDNSWNAGADVAWTVNHDMAFYVSYTHENGYRQAYQRSATPVLNLQSRDWIDTFIVGSKVTVIPEKLFVDANYTFTRSTSAWTTDCTVYGCQLPQPIFPDAHNTLHRLDVNAKYMLDNGFVRTAGWAGKAYVKARVLWERNTADNWQPLSQQLGYAVTPADTTMRRAIFLATGNPNYDVVLGQVAFGVKW